MSCSNFASSSASIITTRSPLMSYRDTQTPAVQRERTWQALKAAFSGRYAGTSAVCRENSRSHSIYTRADMIPILVIAARFFSKHQHFLSQITFWEKQGPADSFSGFTAIICIFLFGDFKSGRAASGHRYSEFRTAPWTRCQILGVPILQEARGQGGWFPHRRPENVRAGLFAACLPRNVLRSRARRRYYGCQVPVFVCSSSSPTSSLALV